MRKFIEESWLVLALGVAIAVALGATQAQLGPQIEKNKRDALEKAVFEVVPGAKAFDEKTLGLQSVFKCRDDKGTLVGWALPAGGYGFQDKIEIVVGLSPDGAKITGMKVLANKETPGLGNKIEELNWRSQYSELDATKAAKVVKGQRKDKAHEIQAITGATISSDAVTRIVNTVVADVGPKLSQLK